MDSYAIAELEIVYCGAATRLVFAAAKLFVVTEAGYRLWYIDVDGMTQSALLHRFNESEDIRVELSGITAGGRRFSGIGYVHPNVAHAAAAIRGDGTLAGFEA
ncbi:hypothetical protein [Paenibacillus humicola]|uniref:hypothetical protein n=1 Tax=Paenibacillus humicola TaxID=3110540 RepID=UPI00237AA634|nr:hypothetical protein [Paenibacillus humicola]